jgi:hypothetical protein
VPYDKTFVESLKLAIPHRSREYDPESRSWLILYPYEDAGLRVARRFYDSIEEVDTRATERSHDNPVMCLQAVRRLFPDHAVLGVLPEAPAEVVQGAYRALVRLHHPDLNGGAGHAETVALNRAYERIGGRAR